MGHSLDPRSLRIRYHFAAAVLLLGGAQGACQRTDRVAAPVLTLMPAAFQGGRIREGEVCLGAGEQATAPVWVHQDTVTFTWRGHAAAGGVLTIDFGPLRVADEQFGGSEGIERTYRASPPRGEQTLTFAVGAHSPGEVCLSQVALTQP